MSESVQKVMLAYINDGPERAMTTANQITRELDGQRGPLEEQRASLHAQMESIQGWLDALGDEIGLVQSIGSYAEMEVEAEHPARNRLADQVAPKMPAPLPPYHLRCTDPACSRCGTLPRFRGG